MPNITDLGNQNLRIDNCIISYPTLFVPRRVGKAGQETGEPRFGANFVLPVLDAADAKILTDTCITAMRAVWPANDAPARDTHHQQAVVATLSAYPQAWWIAFPERDNCAKLPMEQYPDRFLLSANANKDRRPDVFIDGRKVEPGSGQDSQVFGGCIVNLVTRIFCYTRGGTGITAALNGVQLVDNVNVTRLDGGVLAAKAFGLQNPAFPPARSPTLDQPGPAQPPQHQVAPGQAPQPPAPGPQTIGNDVPDWMR